MQNISDFTIFKTEVCQEPLCPSYKESKANNHVLPKSYADCCYYHNKFDKRRDPFEDPVTQKPAYEATEPHLTLVKNGCLNLVEYMYHPQVFKQVQCKQCPGHYCPYYHTDREKQKWDKLLKRTVANEVTLSLDQDTRIDRAVDFSISRDILDMAGGAKPKNLMDEVEELSNNNTQLNDDEDDLDYLNKSYKLNQSRLGNTFLDLVDVEPEEYIDTYANLHPSNISTIKSPELENVDQIEADYKLALKLDAKLNGSGGLGQNEQPMLDIEQKGLNIDSEIDQNFLREDIDDGGTKSEERIKRSSSMNSSKRYEDNRELKKAMSITEEDLQQRMRGAMKFTSRVLMPNNNVPFVYGRTSYIFGDKVNIHENKYNEFKCFRTSQNYAELIEKYFSGFLNSRGGTIYLGIKDEGTAVGIKLDQELLNQLSGLFEKKLMRFTPPVRPSQYCIEAYCLMDTRKNVHLKDHYVLKIGIAQGDPTELYFNDRGSAYIRKQASTIMLNNTAIKDELRARTKRQMSKNLVKHMDESGFDEGLQRQSYEDLKEIKRSLEGKLKLIEDMLGTKEAKKGYDRLLKDLNCPNEYLF